MSRRAGALLLTAFLAAAVVGLFENIIAQFTALAILLPVVAGQSGNAGAQALAVTMRGLALREVSLRDWVRLLNKEALVGVIDGLALAVTCGGGVYLWSRSLGLAVVIGVAMILSMVMAGIAGAVGAFCVLLAFGAGGMPSVVMSIIFAGAPIVNAVVALSLGAGCPKSEEAVKDELASARTYGGKYSRGKRYNPAKPTKKVRKKASRRSDTMFEAVAKSTLRSAGSQLGRTVVRSLLKGLFR